MIDSFTFIFIEVRSSFAVSAFSKSSSISSEEVFFWLSRELFSVPPWFFWECFCPIKLQAPKLSVSKAIKAIKVIFLNFMSLPPLKHGYERLSSNQAKQSFIDRILAFIPAVKPLKSKSCSLVKTSLFVYYTIFYLPPQTKQKGWTFSLTCLS